MAEKNLFIRTLFQCPVCAKPLFQEEKRYCCRKGHSFDIAGKGYVNLLLPSHTGAGKPGDSREMLQSRREFLNKGYYEPFSNHLNELLLSLIVKDKKIRASILDVGCGEGYYTWRLQNRLAAVDNFEDTIEVYGTDVSKAAINYAARRDRSIRFAVASTYHLPILDGVIDYLLCLFAPRDEEEFSRVLKPGGKLIVAAPGPRHLLNLRRVLYDNPELIGERGTVTAGFTLLAQKDISYNIHLPSGEDIINLVGMTPYIRHLTTEAIRKLRDMAELETEVEIKLLVYRKI